MKRTILRNLCRGAMLCALVSFALSGCAVQDGLRFTLSEAEDGYVVRSAERRQVRAEIPSLYAGLPVTEVGTRAFLGHRRLESVTIPDGVTTIGDYAFTSCELLAEVAIPGQLVSVGDAAFGGCRALTEVHFPATLSRCGASAFADCVSLGQVTYAGDLAGWLRIVFENEGSNPVRYARGLYLDGVLLEAAEIPAGTVQVGDYAFYANLALRSVTFPDGLTRVGKFAFEYCPFKTVSLPDSVKEIDEEAFCRCRSMQTLYLGRGIERFGDYAFWGCTSLTDVYYAGTEAEWNAIAPDTLFYPQPRIHFADEGAANP